jgi:uncharacterized cupin superfamily protein
MEIGLLITLNESIEFERVDFMADWKNIVNVKTLTLQPGPGINSYLGDFNRPATEMGAKKLGFNIRSLPPGQYSCPYHFHHEEEELFFILQGRATLRLADQFREVEEGDLIFIPTGPSGVHQFFNHTKENCKMLAISSRDSREVVEYPDSNKVYVSQLKKLFQAGSAVDYWKDELNPDKAWPPLIRQIND